MSQMMPYYPPTEFELLSTEKQIDYVEANLPRLVSDVMEDESIPMFHREILVKVLTNYRYQIEHAIPLEEVRKKLNQR